MKSDICFQALWNNPHAFQSARTNDFWMFQDPLLVSYISVTFFFLDKIQVNPNATKLVQLQSLEGCIPLGPPNYTLLDTVWLQTTITRVFTQQLLKTILCSTYSSDCVWGKHCGCLEDDPRDSNVFVAPVLAYKHRKKTMNTAGSSGQHQSMCVPLQCNPLRHKASSSPALQEVKWFTVHKDWTWR